MSFIKVDLRVKFFTEKNSETFGWFLIMKNDYESKKFANFEEIFHNFGRSDDDMI